MQTADGGCGAERAAPSAPALMEECTFGSVAEGVLDIANCGPRAGGRLLMSKFAREGDRCVFI